VALAKAQGEIRGATKDSTNPHFRSKYADLASVRDAIQGALSKHGIAYLQFPEGGPETITITTILACGEEWMRASYQMRPVKADPQGLGSAITYGRRYALMAAVGVAPEDDDGNAASQGAPANNRPRGNPLRQEFQGFSYELSACKSQEQIDLMLGSPEFEDFEKRDAQQSSGMSFAGMLRDQADQMRKKLPERIRYEGNKIVATTNAEAEFTNAGASRPDAAPAGETITQESASESGSNSLPAPGPSSFSPLCEKIMERFDIVDNADDFKAAQKFALENHGKLTAEEKKALNELSRRVGARLREAA
jgi:hypothetical protein